MIGTDRARCVWAALTSLLKYAAATAAVAVDSVIFPEPPVAKVGVDTTRGKKKPSIKHITKGSEASSFSWMGCDKGGRAGGSALAPVAMGLASQSWSANLWDFTGDSQVALVLA